MVDRLRRWLGLLVARFRFRKRRVKVVSFTRALSDAQRTLLIMPFGPGGGTPWHGVLELLRRRLAGRSITVVTTPQDTESSRVFPGSRIVRISPEDITVLYLPRRAALERALEEPYDLALDLNLDFLLPSAYICRESNARVRMGFLRKRADTFYNFTLQPDPALSAEGIYDRLARTLQMF